MELETLIDRASAIAGSMRKLAALLGVTHSNVSEWRSGKRHCPDEKLIAMARMVSADPEQTALEVVRTRWRKLVTTAAAGAVAIIGGFAALVDDAHAAGPNSEHYV